MATKVKLRYSDDSHNYVCPLCKNVVYKCSNCNKPLDDTTDVFHVHHKDQHVCGRCKLKLNNRWGK